VIAQLVYRWAIGWVIGVLVFDSQQGLGIFLFTTASRTPLGPTKPPIQWIPGALSLGVKRPGREADHSPSYSAEVKEYLELYLTPQYAFVALCSVIKSRETTLPFTFTFIHFVYLVVKCRVFNAIFLCFISDVYIK
jgi:hypothetical protein